MLQARLAGVSEERPLDARRPVSLIEADHAWLVLHGEVDVFSVRFEGNTPAGPRRFLRRFGPGDLLFGQPPMDAIGAIGLVAVGHPDTAALRVPISALDEALQDSVLVDTIVDRIDHWVQALSELLPDRMPRRQRRHLAPGVVEPISAGALISATDGVVWVDCPKTEVRFVHHLVDPSSDPDARLPVTPQTWLSVSSDVGIRTTSTVDTLKHGIAENASLDWFHREALTILAQQAVFEVRKGMEWLAETIEADRDQVSRTLHRMGAVEDRNHATQATQTDHEPPLLAACRIVCRAMDLELGEIPWRDAEKKGRDLFDEIVLAAQLRKRKVVLKGEWWKGDHGPLLAYRTYGAASEPVALLPRAGRGNDLVEPAASDRVRLTEGLANTIEPEAWQLYRPLPSGELKAMDLYRFSLSGVKTDLAVVIGIGMIGGLLGLVTPLVTGQIFDRVIPGADRGFLAQLVIAMLAIAFGQALFSITRSIALLRAEIRMDAWFQAAVWDRLLGLPLTFYRRFAAGDLATRAQGIDAIRRTLSGVVLASVLAGVFSIWNLGLLFYLEAKLALIALVLIAVAAVVSVVASLQQLRFQRTLMHLEGQISGLLLQLLTGIAKLRVSGTEGRAFAQWGNLFAEKREVEYQAGEIRNNFSVFDSVFSIVSSIVLFMAVLPILAESQSDPKKAFSLGSFLAFFAAYGTLTAACLGLVRSVLGVLQIVPLWERAQPIIQEVPEIASSGVAPPDLTGRISLDRLSFRYSDEGPIVINDVSLDISPGQFIAIVGPSGSGKSTLFRLLLGFEKPTSGGVYYDEQDLSRLDIRKVRRQLGVVLQTSTILGGDIYHNIAGAGRISMAEAWAAAEMAALADDIRDMPMGLHTVIGPGGGTLSGGQRQRLLIARALAQNPEILLFDEATSALDNRTQAMVSASLERLQITRIVVAHRLSTVQNADSIVVVERGRIVEQGNYNELMANNGPFATLAQRQLA